MLCVKSCIDKINRQKTAVSKCMQQVVIEFFRQVLQGDAQLWERIASPTGGMNFDRESGVLIFGFVAAL